MHPTKILHPTDYSDASRPALKEALALAEEHHATLVLLHVVDSLGPETLSFGESVSADQPAEYRRRLFEEMRQLLPAGTLKHVECVLSEEDLVTAILRAQIERGCDLIVLGTHGETGVRRWFTGSVAEEVVRRASCPVLVVKQGAKPDHLPSRSRTSLHPGQIVDGE